MGGSARPTNRRDARDARLGSFGPGLRARALFAVPPALALSVVAQVGTANVSAAAQPNEITAGRGPVAGPRSARPRKARAGEISHRRRPEDHGPAHSLPWGLSPG